MYSSFNLYFGYQLYANFKPFTLKDVISCIRLHKNACKNDTITTFTDYFDHVTHALDKYDAL